LNHWYFETGFETYLQPRTQAIGVKLTAAEEVPVAWGWSYVAGGVAIVVAIYWLMSSAIVVVYYFAFSYHVAGVVFVFVDYIILVNYIVLVFYNMLMFYDLL